MIKILVIVPHPDLHDKAEAALREYAVPGAVYDITHAFGTKIETMHVGGADIIVARGLTQRAIARAHKELTVLELTVSAYDIIRAIHACRMEHRARRIAVIGSDSVIYDVGALQEILGGDLRVFRVGNEQEILKALGEAEKDGYDTMVGGLTACILARERGWACTMMRTSEETLRLSIKEAMNTAQVMLTERAKAEISRAILQNSREGIMYFDHGGNLALFNRRVQDVLNLPQGDTLTGRGVEEIFLDGDIRDTVRTRREAHGLLKTVNRNLVMADFVPVRLEGKSIGVVCTFQPVNEIQAAETKIRKELGSKGLVAKYGFDDIIHAGAPLEETIATAHKYADVDANVLLVGETGTGKELFAQSIHSASRRHDGPFVAVNCAAFTATLLESELFGYADGAFTGAAKGGKIGLFELAHGGTLFLDEIGEIPMTLQATLLRALQEREIRRIGADKVIPVNVRIIAATNMDLREKVAAGDFRLDLLYRLDVLSLRIPPLRERRDDIPRIAEHYLERYRLKYAKPGLTLGDDAMAVLKAHSWPGNIRELRNICERLAVLGGENATIGGETAANSLALAYSGPNPTEQAKSLPQEPGNEDLDQLVELANTMRMNRADIATMLGISRTTLWRRMNKKEKEQLHTRKMKQ